MILNKNSNYKLYKSKIIVDNKIEIIKNIYNIQQKITKNLNTNETTWSYSKYNFFQMSCPEINCYYLYKELKKIIRDYVNHNRPLWFQSWLNFHMPDQVLDWHNHYWPYHGYICVDAKNTKTIFEDYEILNEDGNIYIGLGNKKHKVEVLKNYNTPRITIGFDVTESDDIFQYNSFLPLD